MGEVNTNAQASAAGQKVGVLFISTGSPSAPTPEAVHDYLEAYLTDQRLVDIPRAKWYPILYGIILRKRPPRTAARYKKIWTPEGSPLVVLTERQRKGLQASLAREGHDVPVVVCNRYAKPSIDDGIHELACNARCDRIVVVTCYPQYASVTNGTMYQEVFTSLAKLKRIPSVATIDSYHDEELYLKALTDKILSSWHYEPDGKHYLVFSYHSTLCADMEQGDVYEYQTHHTAQLVAERLGLRDEDWDVGYQSVFDKGRPWLGPITETELIPEVARRGYTDLAVVAPGFTTDCLETHYDIDTDQRHAFESLVPQGKFTYVHCLNDDPTFIEALATVVEREL